MIIAQKYLYVRDLSENIRESRTTTIVILFPSLRCDLFKLLNIRCNTLKYFPNLHAN